MKRFKKLVITSLIGVLLSTSPMSALAAYSGTKVVWLHNVLLKQALNSFTWSVKNTNVSSGGVSIII